MRNTAPTPIRQRPVTADTVDTWARDEVIPALTELRRAANYASREVGTCTTAGDGVAVSIWRSTVMRPNTIWNIQADIIGFAADLSVRASYVIRGLFYNNSVIWLQGGLPTYVVAIESAAACDAYFAIDNTAFEVLVKVRDEATTAMRWEAIVDWREYPHP